MSFCNLVNRKLVNAVVLLALVAGLVACGPRGRDSAATGYASGAAAGQFDEVGESAAGFNYDRSSIRDILGPNRTERSVQVNRYLWRASLEVLNFLPVQAVDPFTGVIVTGYGTPPGGSRAYRATIHISDPALDARSLNVSLQTRDGAVSAATARTIEDAILSRARQFRLSDRNL